MKVIGEIQFFLHILVSKQRGTITGVLQKVLKMVTFSLQAERRALEDILANSTDCLVIGGIKLFRVYFVYISTQNVTKFTWLQPIGETFHALRFCLSSFAILNSPRWSPRPAASSASSAFL